MEKIRTTKCFLESTHHGTNNPKALGTFFDCPLFKNNICEVCCHHIKNEGGDEYLKEKGFDNPTFDYVLKLTVLSEEQINKICKNCPNYCH